MNATRYYASNAQSGAMHAIIVHVMNVHSLQKIDAYAQIATHIACIAVSQYYTAIYIIHVLVAIMTAALLKVNDQQIIGVVVGCYFQ